MKDLQFRMKWKANIDGEEMERIETEASWFLLTQTGKILSHGPMRPIKEHKIGIDGDYSELTPLVKIHDRYLSIEEIEELITP